jgi:hypothetical protein
MCLKRHEHLGLRSLPGHLQEAGSFFGSWKGEGHNFGEGAGTDYAIKAEIIGLLNGYGIMINFAFCANLPEWEEIFMAVH